MKVLKVTRSIQRSYRGCHNHVLVVMLQSRFKNVFCLLKTTCYTKNHTCEGCAVHKARFWRESSRWGGLKRTGPHKSLSELVQRCVGTKTEKNCGGSDFKGFAGCNTRPKCFSWRNLIWKRLSDKCPAPPKILTKNQPGVYTVRWTDS